jgi:hypothetical protein
MPPGVPPEVHVDHHRVAVDHAHDHRVDEPDFAIEEAGCQGGGLGRRERIGGRGDDRETQKQS